MLNIWYFFVKMCSMEEKKKRRLLILSIIIFVLVLAAMYVYLYILPDIRDSRNENAVVTYARVEDQQKAECVVIRDETVVTSGGAGSVSYFVEEGVKTRKYSKVADVYSGGQRDGIMAPVTGFVSYYLDGLEEVLDPERFEELVPTEVAEMEKKDPESSKPDSVDGDRPIFKMVGSDVWYVAAVIPAAEKIEYTHGQSVEVEFPDGFRAAGTVEMSKEDDKYCLVIISIKRYYEKFSQIRWFGGTVVSSVAEGLLVPVDSIGTNGENNGVYVLEVDGNYVFRAVEIIKHTPDGILIQDGGAVSLYDEVLKDASRYQE